MSIRPIISISIISIISIISLISILSLISIISIISKDVGKYKISSHNTIAISEIRLFSLIRYVIS